MHLPPPPSLKTTIIQLNKDIDPEDNNYEILNNAYNPSTSGRSLSSSSAPAEQPKKKRRRSNSFVDDKELARRRNETKQLHSIIEKRRRIKINREFEALKYIIPACRNSENNSKKNASSNNNSKIDGMYKLTILKSSVEYILYLHHIIQKQHELLSKSLANYSYDIGYTEIPIDVNQYRNIDKEFHFADLATPSSKSASTASNSIGDIAEDERGESDEISGQRLLLDAKEAKDPNFDEEQLPSPDRTPDIAPVFSLRARGSYDSKYGFQHPSQSQILFENYLLLHLDRSSQYQSSRVKSGSLSSATSPFTIPIKLNTKRGSFLLPDPAIPAGTPMLTRDEPTSVPLADSHPKRMYFKSRVPPNNLTAQIGNDSEDDDFQVSEEGRLEDASKLLLLLRKPSIEKLLN